MASVNQDDRVNSSSGSRLFLSGVVEGFYGRPWTPEQRKDLFSKQQKWGMSCYLYAPKDDYKHRAYWRELYTVEEAEHLQALIAEATHHNIIFYYAISPGLDIAYSSQKEIAALKRKLEQVKQLGCNAFALLFDDIDPEMSGPDKEVYQSFAHAQVSVANEIYTHLDQPKFMFCPTQYCSSRAVPSVQTSEYLNTLGSKLAPEIDIMWTGPKVISKTLSIEHIREVTSVIRRPPVIWDNLHANDYDQARLFLGPYCGRSPSLIPLLRGVVTNPNCEYGPNFIAIHTLAQWSKSVADENCSDSSDIKDDAVSADIRLETEGDDMSGSYCPTGLPSSSYHPRRALRLALQDWLEEFGRNVMASGPIQQPQIPTVIPIVPSVNTCMSLTTAITATLPTLATNVNQIAEVMQDSNLIPQTNIVMNSLVSETKVDTLLPEQLPEAKSSSSISQDQSSSSSAEPMDCNQSPAPSPILTNSAEAVNVEDITADDQMVVEPIRSEVDSESSAVGVTDSTDSNGTLLEDDHHPLNPDLQLTLDDLLLLADLFYLPFEHGKKSVTLMTEFNWLKTNSHLVIEHNRNNPDGTRKPEVQEWFDKAAKFEEISRSVKKLSDRLFNVRNRSLLYELYPYVWDMRGVVSLLNSYVQWLALGQVSSLVSSYVLGNYTWFSKGWKEAFMSGDQEPWIFRGGLTAELQRLVPVDASNDLFQYKAPEFLINKCFIIRPYLESDRANLYNLVLQTADDGKDSTSLYESHPQLPGDILVGSYLRPEGCEERVLMVVEDEEGHLVGYCCAAANAKAHNKLQAQHILEIREKYPKVLREDGTLLSACEELLASLWDEATPFPPCLNAPTNMMAPSVLPPPLVQPTISPEEASNTPPSSSPTGANDDLISTLSVESLIPPEPVAVSAAPPIAAAAPAPLTPSPTPSPDLSVNGNIVRSIVTAPATGNSVGDLLPYYPAVIRLALLPTVTDESIIKRLVTCILASLRAKGGFGGHVCVPCQDANNLNMYNKVGFSQIGSVKDAVYLARSF